MTGRRRLLFIVAVATIMASLSLRAAIADAAAGRGKAVKCQTCHGIDGLSKVPDAPNLAGQPGLYLASQLRSYRAGTRQHEIMGTLAQELTDRDIDDLADWYSSLEVTVKMPP
jgi:cytochrome c553